MPWKDTTVSDLRLTFVHQVVTLGEPVAVACRRFNISRKTGHKWIKRFQKGGSSQLRERSRRPKRSPAQIPPEVEHAIVQTYRQFGWGARKVHAYLLTRRPDLSLPSPRTVHAALGRNGCVQAPSPAQAADQRFERSRANELWQLDFKGPIEIQRQKVTPLTIMDDHSRYLFRHLPCDNLSHSKTFETLWDLMGEVGMPESLLCDNYFNTRGYSNAGLSWFDAQLIRLNIRPIHGRPYHPQTQGKIERLHGTLTREAYPRVDRSSIDAFAAGINTWREDVYNTVRPHEALGMLPPISRWQPSERQRPHTLPEIEYPANSLLRKVQRAGWIQFRGHRILIGSGLAGQVIRIAEEDDQLVIYYAHKPIRRLVIADLDRYAVN